MHSHRVCSNGYTMNKPQHKAENSLLIYDIIIAQRCFLFILIVFSILVTESWAAHIPRQSQSMLWVWHLWTRPLFITAVSADTSNTFQLTQLAAKTASALQFMKYLQCFLKDKTGSQNNSKSFLWGACTLSPGTAQGILSLPCNAAGSTGVGGTWAFYYYTSIRRESEKGIDI